MDFLFVGFRLDIALGKEQKTIRQNVRQKARQMARQGTFCCFFIYIKDII